MQFLHGKSNIDFLGKRKVTLVFSLLLTIFSIASLTTRGLNFGIDFTGGYLIELGYPDSVELGPVRATMEQNGFSDAQIQHFGTSKDILIRLAPRKGVNQAELSETVISVLQASSDQKISMRRIEFVGHKLVKN